MNTDDPPILSNRAAVFDRLMDSYEQNYILLRRLFGDLRRLQAGDECPWNAAVMPKIVASGRFTLDIHFVDHSIFGHKQQPLKLKVRIYHDARTAELLDAARRDRCLQTKATQCAEKQFKRNALLQQWLIKQLDSMTTKQN